MTAALLAAAAVGLATTAFGWLAVPVIGLWIGLGRVARRPVVTAALAGALGWGSLLAWGAMTGPVEDLARLLGAVVGVPAGAVVAATLVFPAVLAGAAAAVGSAVWEGGEGGGS